MHFSPKNFPRHAYDFYQYPNPQYQKTGLYESNYLKANSPDGKFAVWLKHNVLLFKNQARPPVAELWGIFFERGLPPQVFKQELSLDQFTTQPDRLEFSGPRVFLSPTRTETTVSSGNQQMSWSLKMDEIHQPPMVHYAYAAMYTGPLPKKKMVTPAPESIWNGFLLINGRQIEVKDWIGFRNHNWGTEHAHTYAYGNCNLFDGALRTYFDGYSAKIKIGPILTPWLSNCIFRRKDRDLAMNGIIQSVLTPAVVEFPNWKAEWTRGKSKIILSQSAAKESFVGLCYHHPSGQKSYCYNSKFANTELTLIEAGQKTVFTSELGELEFLFPEPIDGIEVFG